MRFVNEIVPIPAASLARRQRRAGPVGARAIVESTHWVEPLVDQVGVKDGQLYLEAHQPFPEHYYNSPDITDEEEVADAVFENPYSSESKVDWSEALKLIKDTYGYPVQITDINN